MEQVSRQVEEEKKMLVSRAKTAIALLLLLAALSLLLGCAADETPTPKAAPVTAASPEPGEELAEPTEELATEAPTAAVEEASQEEEQAEPEGPSPELTPIPIVVVDVDSACVNCHTERVGRRAGAGPSLLR
jgi:hypothetical protein